MGCQVLLLGAVLWALAGGEAERLLDEAHEHCVEGRFDEGAAAFEEAIRLMEGEGSGREDLARAYNGLGYAHHRRGRAEESIVAFERALASFREVHTGDHEEIASGLGNLATSLEAAGRPGDALPLQQQALAMYRRLFDGDHERLAVGLNNLANTLDILGRSAEALPLLEQALAMRRRLFPGDHIEVAQALGNLAGNLQSLGRPADALPLRTEALAMARRLVDGDHPAVASSLLNLGTTLAALGRPADALPLHEEALAMFRRIFEGDHPSVATSLGTVADTLDALGRPAAALPLHEEALAMGRRLFPGDHPAVAARLDHVADALVGLGRPAEALALHEEALAMSRRLFAGDHPDVAASLHDVALVLTDLGRAAEARPLHEEALAMLRHLCRGDHPKTAASLGHLAHTLVHLGCPAEALPLLEESLAMRRRLFPADHYDLVLGLSNLAHTLGALGRTADALPLYEAALSMSRRLFPGDHPAVASGLHNLAAAYNSLDRHADALPLQQESLAMQRRLVPGDHPDLARCLNNLGATLLWLGRAAESLPLQQEALAMRQRLFPGAHADVALGLHNLAFVLDTLGRRAEARAHWQQSARMGREAGWPLRHRPLAAIGADLLASGDAAGALAPLAEAVEHVESLRASARTLTIEERARYDAEARVSDPFPLIIEALAALGRPAEALSYAERGRARMVQDLLEQGRGDPLAEAAARARAAGDAAAVERLESAARAVAEAEAAVVVRAKAHEQARAGRVRATIRAALDAEGEARRALERALRVRLSLLRGVLPETRPLPADAIQALLRPGERMLVYSLGDRASFVFLVRPTGEPVEAIRLAKPLPRIEEASARVLFEAFVPARAWAEVKASNRVYLCAHGALHRIAFETLVVGDGPRYWIDEAPPVAYVPSASVLGWLAARPGPRAPRLVALGDPRFDGLAPLPGTRREIDAIRAAFGASDFVALLGDEATEQRLLAAAPGAGYLHLATHGVAPGALALAKPPAPEPGDDGLLTFGDLLERWRGRLDGTGLVVLSACESQKGRFERDEGMFALPLGFWLAGARAVVASLWKVEDERTALLMGDLYRRMLSEGAVGACDALHGARRALRRSHPDPRHWGAFVFLGAP